MLKTNKERYERTVKLARELAGPKPKGQRWGVLRRKAVYGHTKSSVRKSLIATEFCGKRIVVHRKVVKSLHAVQTRIRKAEETNGWARWTPEVLQCFNWRVVRGGTSLSRHAHAIALDIDPKDNGMSAHYDKRDKTTIPIRVIKAFEAEGWTWGGRWDAPCDAMHFERH